MDQNWKKFIKWQWSETKKYFDLTDPTRRSPPLLVKVVGLFSLLILLLWIVLSFGGKN